MFLPPVWFSLSSSVCLHMCRCLPLGAPCHDSGTRKMFRVSGITRGRCGRQTLSQLQFLLLMQQGPAGGMPSASSIHWLRIFEACLWVLVLGPSDTCSHTSPVRTSCVPWRQQSHPNSVPPLFTFHHLPGKQDSSVQREIRRGTVSAHRLYGVLGCRVPLVFMQTC